MSMLKRLGALSASVILATGLAVAIAPAPAMAHGTTMFPGNRTFLCWQDGLRDNGQIIAYNPACAGAIAQSGTRTRAAGPSAISPTGSSAAVVRVARTTSVPTTTPVRTGR